MLSREIVNSGLFTRGGQWLTKSRLTLGCLGLIGASTLGSVVVLEAQDQKIFSLLTTIGNAIGNRSSGSSEAPAEQAQEENLSESINGFITGTLWSTVRGVFETSWSGISSSVTLVVDLFSQTSEVTGKIKAEELGKGILQFLKNFFSAKFFYNFFSKFFNFVQSVTNSETRASLIGLFSASKDNQLNKTLDLIKLLLGLKVLKSNLLKADPEVFNFLFLQLLDKPKEVIRKFESLSKLINRLTTSLGDKGTEGQETKPEVGSEKNSYMLQKKDLTEYFNLPGRELEIIYEEIWMNEIFTKIKLGKDWTFNSKLALAKLGKNWKWLSWTLPNFLSFKFK